MGVLGKERAGLEGGLYRFGPGGGGWLCSVGNINMGTIVLGSA